MLKAAMVCADFQVIVILFFEDKNAGGNVEASAQSNSGGIEVGTKVITVIFIRYNVQVGWSSRQGHGEVWWFITLLYNTKPRAYKG
jgi:hypothetical protein